MSRNAATELEPLVNNYEHLSDKRRAPEALQALRKIASLVKPLMRQRNWRVGTLAEFYPRENNLLGLNTNSGQRIDLRLRHAGDENQFLPIEQVVDTMLHELAHIIQGPHDQHFYALWDKLRDEHQALTMKGYTGEGFLGQGSRLGGRRMPLNEARRQARAAAERRKTLNNGSGQRLGGTGIMRGQDPRAVIAAAVERRKKIEEGCASNTEKGRLIAREQGSQKNMTRTTVDHEDEDEATMMQAYIDLIQEDEQQQMGDLYIPPSQENPAGSKSLPKEPSNKLLQQQREIENNIRRQKTSTPPQYPKSKPNTSSKSRDPSPPLAPVAAPDTWTCEICTLVNPIAYLTCDACTIERPPHISAQLPSLSSPPTKPEPTARSTSTSTPSIHNRERPPAFASRGSAYDNLKRFEQAGAQRRDTKPLGWMCHGCGNFMEQEWWTCSACGTMRATS